MTKTPAKFQKGLPTAVCKQGIYYLYYLSSKNDPSSKLRKGDKKIISGIYQKQMDIFRPWQKHLQSFKKNCPQLKEDLCPRGTNSMHTWYLFVLQKTTKFKLSKKW